MDDHSVCYDFAYLSEWVVVVDCYKKQDGFTPGYNYLYVQNLYLN